jgi:3-oxoadipate CoA-transferase, alpha subunit
MLDKRYESAAEALADVRDGSTILVGGFGGSGLPSTLINALADTGATGLTIVSNNVGAVGGGVATLISNHQVTKIICTFPVGPHAADLVEQINAGKVEVELVPQGTLAERIRAGGAGIPAFFTPTGAHTELAAGKEARIYNGREHLLEEAIVGDFALIKADRADRWGNLTYRRAQRNFNAVMATAAGVTVAEYSSFVELGDIEPEAIVTPSLFVGRLVHVPVEPQAGSLPAAVNGDAA